MFQRSAAKIALVTSLFLIACVAVAARLRFAPKPMLSNAGAAGKTRALSNYGTFPIYFEPGAGHAGASVRYFSHTGDYTLSITQDGAMLVPAPRAVDTGA